MSETRFGHPPQTWAASKAEVREILGARARAGATIAYSELAGVVRTVLLEPDSTALAHMLGEISTEEDQGGRGMLSVVVVHKDGDKMPGSGFFELARRLGRDPTDRLACWASEMQLVQRSWARSREGSPAPPP